MSIITPRHVNWAAQECYWQQSGEMSVAWMLEGFRYAHRRRHRVPNVVDIIRLGRIVEPRRNREFRFRTVNVRVGWDVKLPHEEVPGAIDRLVTGTAPLNEITEDIAAEWFHTYEEIHPWADGNGRTGSILYNWLRGSLPEPIHPPNLWDDPRRGYPEYPEPIL